MAGVGLHRKMWFTTLALIIFGWITVGTSGQVSSSNIEKAKPIAEVPRTKFSCQGRGSGYYADVDTGCQVYHMCDGLGRQFSYACPNTTLFQQRMLVCDHWYMVNCSRAESNYRANLLIGQKDKPFVPEEENEIRTPRPDLLDRPYAPDYSGESYRKSFKNNFQAPQNAIAERDNSKVASKRIFSPEILQESASVHGAAIHWGTKYSQKDSIETTSAASIASASNKVNNISSRRDVKEEANAGATKNDNLRNVQLKFSSQAGNQKSNSGPLSTNSPIEAVKPSVKTPSKIYEPPLLEPDYSKIPAKQTTTTTRRPTFATSPRTQTTYRTSQRVTTTTPRLTKPTTTTVAPTTSLAAIGKSLAAQNSFKAFENFLNSNKKTTYKDYDFSKYFTNQSGTAAALTATTPTTRATTTRTTRRSTTTSTRATTTTTTTPAPRISGKILHRPHPSQPTPSQRPSNVPGFLREPLIPPPYRGQPTTTARPSTTTERFLPREPLISGPNRPININEPSQDLQPPFIAVKEYDDSSTQGPPIYYEWKWSVPAFILEPPLSPVQDSENSSSQRSTNVQGRNGLSKSLLPPEIVSSIDNSEKNDNHSATTRSVVGTTHNEDLDSSKIVFKKIAQYDFNNLQKEFLIPKFDFPLETVDDRAADRYDDINKLTSFLVKIPEDVRSAVAKKPWYGENSQCPDCHPSFVVPGTCAPCIKIRR